MGVPIDELWKKAGLRSRDALALRVAELWGDSKQKPRNIGVKLYELIQGKTVWWERRPEAARALATALEVDLEELQLSSPKGESLFVFEDFPLARAFDARGEVPCSLGNEYWVQPIGAGTRWIHAPPGTGRSFTAHVHRYRHGTKAIRVSTLAEALPSMGKPGPLLIEVERTDEKDPLAEQQLLTRGSVLVIAPFPSWSQRNPAPPEEPRGKAITSFEDLVRPPAPKNLEWEHLSWTPRPNWRERFIRWLCGRVSMGVQFNLEDMLRWLELEDPRARLFATPGDLLALCGFAHEQGRGWKPHTRSSFTHQWLDSRLSRKGAPSTPQAPWLHLRGKETLRALIQHWFESPEPWLGPLTKHRWMELLPEESTRTDTSMVQRHLEELVNLPKRQQARKRDEILAALAVPHREEAFRYLTSARFFQVEDEETWSFRFAWLANLMAKEFIGSTLRKGAPARWGRWAVQSDRRGLIDALLDELSEEDLLDLIGRTVEEFQVSSLGAIGAVEALFAAVARRLRKGVRFDAARVLPLWTLQTTTFAKRHDDGPPIPLTRPEIEGEELRWLEVCWLWSFQLDSPPSLPTEFEGLFPGWCRLSLARLPEWFRYEQESPLLLDLTLRLVERCVEGDTLPPSLPHLLLPACLLLGEQRGWKLEVEHVTDLLSHSELRAFVLRKMEASAPEVRQKMAGQLWRGCLGSYGNYYVHEKPDSPFRLFLDKNLTWEDFRASLTDDKLREFAINPESIPPHLQGAVLREALSRWPKLGSDMLTRGRQFEAELLELLLSHHQPRYMVIRAFWKWHPERARTLAQDALRSGNEDTRNWFWEAPEQEVPFLLKLLEAHPTPVETWGQRWMTYWLPRAGQLSERLHALWLKNTSRA